MTNSFDPVREGMSLLAATRWRVHRARIDGFGNHPQFSAGPGRRVLFITKADKICRSQIFPFFYYAPQIRKRYLAQMREVPLATFKERPGTIPGPVDVVCLQTGHDVSAEEMHALVDQIRTRYPSSRIVYLDWFAPTDCRLAEMLHEHVDVYVKKHVFRELGRYGVPTRGDTNLMDHYSERYGLSYASRLFRIPEGFLDKLVVGPSFLTANYILPRLLADGPARGQRPIDVHARLGSEGTDWYSQMRRESIAALESMHNLRIASKLGVGRSDYLRELSESKLCFSPFGYGEVCWRDYEAVMCGTLLIKPDTSHVRTDPDIFVAGETYVPIRWDFADLEEKVRYYLSHEDERRAIVERAWSVLRDYARSERFVDHMRPILTDRAPAALTLVA